MAGGEQGVPPSYVRNASRYERDDGMQPPLAKVWHMIEVKIDEPEVRKALASLRRKLGDLNPAMHDIGEELAKNMQDCFRDGRAALGRPPRRCRCGL